MTTIDTCPIRVWDGWFSHICDRPVKDEGLCGIHLRSKREEARKTKERAEKREQARQKLDRDEARVAQSEDLASRLQDAGIDALAAPEYVIREEERPLVLLSVEAVEQVRRIISEKA